MFFPYGDSNTDPHHGAGQFLVVMLDFLRREEAGVFVIAQGIKQAGDGPPHHGLRFHGGPVHVVPLHQLPGLPEGPEGAPQADRLETERTGNQTRPAQDQARAEDDDQKGGKPGPARVRRHETDSGLTLRDAETTPAIITAPPGANERDSCCSGDWEYSFYQHRFPDNQID